MTEISKNFEHDKKDEYWYNYWLSKGYFNSQVDNTKTPYTIVIPPPNVTGVLHMGHCLNNTIQDILIRRARQQGFNACWVPGTDHASIATEAKVVAMLRERGITKSSLSREEFLKYAWEWKEKYGGIILQQLKKLGCSLDWNRTSFTMDDDYYKAVIKIFVQLYNDGIIYRGLRMVNWDPASKTALSDEEVIYKEVDSKLYYVKYPFADGSGQFMMVATTRPETILGDVAICVNPNDERYKNWIGKEVIVPIINRKINIIADEYVDAEFGTGALKITPAHDKNDNEIGRKHNLKTIDTLDADGKFTAEQLEQESISDLVKSYVGVDRFDLRKKIVEDIATLGQIEKIEEYKGQVGTSERTGAVIENRLSMQWFMDMKKFIANNPETLTAVMNDEIVFHPAKAKNTYKHWIENIKDWCISRQLWWGQQIPAWYDEKGNYYVAENLETLHNEKPETRNAKLVQDEDCLDTWFSSWIWPMEVFKGISNPDNEEVNYYYPTTTLVTGQDIIFFWVARMIMAGYEFKNQQPFKDVYFTGMVRDKQGRKMSKQLGNSPDLLGLIDKYGADAVRFGIMISSPAGNDLLFDESSLEQGRNFNNKLWNAMKLVKMWSSRQSTVDSQPMENNFGIVWFENRLNEVKQEVENLMKQFQLSAALKVIYSLIWDDFCSWYLEWIKPGFEQPIEANVYNKTIEYFDELLQILHPFMPIVTEEIYHQLKERNEDLTVKNYSNVIEADNSILESGQRLKNDITALREIRAKHQLKNSQRLDYSCDSSTQNFYNFNQDISRILQKQTGSLNTDYYEFVAISKEGGIEEMINNRVLVVSSESKFFVYLNVDKTSQKEDLLKDLDYQKGSLEIVMKKLGNERFMANAKPDVLASEQKKKADIETRIKTIKESLATL